MIRLYIAAGAIVAALAAGAYVAHRLNKVDDLEAAVTTSEGYRDAERLQARSRAAIMDGYTKRLKVESRRAADARADLARVLSAPRYPAAAEGAATCGPERARIGELEQLARESAILLEEGSRHVEQLRNDRQALTEAAK